MSRLNAIPEYRRLFARAFGGTTPVTDGNLGRALAAFQRTLVASNSPFDRYMRGDTTALTPEQFTGMERFQSVGCINCHNGPMFSDFEPHVLAVPDNRKLTEPDSGVSKTYAFRTPSLRNLGVTAPYMHNGVFASLQDVVNHYQRISGRGGRGRRAGTRDQSAGQPRSGRSAGAPVEHARTRSAGPHRVPPGPGRSQLRSHRPQTGAQRPPGRRPPEALTTYKSA